MAKPKTKKNGSVKYSVEEYLAMLRRAKRSEQTIKGYYKVFQSYAKFLKVPLDEVHHHLSVQKLLKYSDSRNGMSDNGNKTNLNVLRRYFTQNGVEFDELEYNATNPTVTKEQNDKPLELATIQKMMDHADPHGKAILTTLISTGMRAGECCKILLSDVGRLENGQFVPDITGDCIRIPNEIAKRKHGGIVFLTDEAREFIAAWLKERDEYIRISDKRMKGLLRAGAHHRPKKDDRLFATAYTGLNAIFGRLYAKAGGGKGKYHNTCTPHSCRKFHRTAAARSMHPDLVTNNLRQTGYLDNTYVRIPLQQKHDEFMDGQHALFITRADHRIQISELEKAKQKTAALEERLAQVERERASTKTPKELIDKIFSDPEAAAYFAKRVTESKSQ